METVLPPALRTPSIAAFRASAWSVGLAGGHGCGQICLREGVGAAQCIGRPVPVGHVPGRVRRVSCGHPGGGGEQRAYRGSVHGRHRVGGRMEPGPDHAGHRDAGLGVWLGLLARALAGMPAIWPAVGGVSPARSPSGAPQAGSGASARSGGARRIAGSPRAVGVVLMPGSRQPDDGAGKYPEMPVCENSTTRYAFPACLTLGGGASFPIRQVRRHNSRNYGRCIHFGAGRIRS